LKDLQEKLRSLGATEEAETAEVVAIEPQDRTFQKVMFGAGIEEEIETRVSGALPPDAAHSG